MSYPLDDLGLFLDLYELTMVQGFFKRNPNQEAVFDTFIRKAPFSESEGYVVLAGLDPLLEVLENFHFNEEAILFLKKQEMFSEEFLTFLKEFRFNGTLESLPEGSVIFPNEPFLRVKGTLIECQLVEGVVLNFLNFQSLIATKASRLIWGAGAKNVLEFGLRRAQGVDGALSATRATIIGGAKATSNVLAGKLFNIPIKGTMAHSWVMSFDTEREAFQTYAELYPNACTLLIDTYNTLESGIKNAIPILQNLKEKDYKNFGIRIDSGDLDYLSKKVREELDKANLKEAFITVSNDLDENIISQMISSNVPIDVWGVGTKLVTGGNTSSLSGVFKLCAMKEKNSNSWQDKMKVTDNISKTSQPGIKNVIRFFNKNKEMIGDLIFLEEEKEDLIQKLEKKETIKAYHPFNSKTPWKIQEYTSFEILLNPIMKEGKRLEAKKELIEIQKKTFESFKQLNPRYYRLVNPHIYKVGLSENLFKKKEYYLKSYENNVSHS